ncbi:MAG: helix-turn-helix protein [Chryseobacterium sp.]|jgi:excisionase family DNA binding protein|nr:helix-turn-helix protein [Chryseobacterium sp.]
MSSNIRVCQHCGIDFKAKTTVTKYCSDNCAKRAYKLRIKTAKIQASDDETKEIRNKPISDLNSKDYLNVKEVALLLGCAERSIYSMISSGRLKAVNLLQRKIRIHRAEVEVIFENPALLVIPKAEMTDFEQPLLEQDCYSIGQIEQDYKINIRTGQGWVYLTTFIDLFDRKVIGWSLSETMKAQDTSIAALKMARLHRPLQDQDNLIFH